MKAYTKSEKRLIENWGETVIQKVDAIISPEWMRVGHREEVNGVVANVIEFAIAENRTFANLTFKDVEKVADTLTAESDNKHHIFAAEYNGSWWICVNAVDVEDYNSEMQLCSDDERPFESAFDYMLK